MIGVGLVAEQRSHHAHRREHHREPHHGCEGAKAQLAERKPNGQGVYDFDTGDLPLEWGLNNLEVLAENEGGRTRVAVLLVNVVEVPVRIELVELTVDDTKEAVTKTPEGKLSAADGKVTLKGKIQWSSRNKNDAKMRAAHEVWVRANGFRQRAAILNEAKDGLAAAP